MKWLNHATPSNAPKVASQPRQLHFASGVDVTTRHSSGNHNVHDNAEAKDEVEIDQEQLENESLQRQHRIEMKKLDRNHLCRLVSWGCGAEKRSEAG